MNTKSPTLRHIIIKIPKAKNKQRILKLGREKQLVVYKGAPIRPSANFSTETLQARREWHKIFKVMRTKDLQQRLLYPARLSFRIIRKKRQKEPCLVWLRGLSVSLQTKGSPVQMPVRAPAWVAGQVPSRGHTRDNHTLMFLSLSPSLPSCLSKINKILKKKYF